jgi:hypothetical protein
MLTHCSQCKKTYSISVEELRTRSTLLYCPNCEEMLGRLSLFKADFFAGNTIGYPRFNFWLIGCLLCVLLFLTQIYLVKRDEFSQNPEQRLWLEQICQRLHCKLPVYKSLDEFEILHGDFQLAGDHYEFQTVLSNQADFAQNYPRIKLNLLNFNGQIFAERVFYPHEYSGAKPNQLMPASETIEINLNIALPSQKVGGYTFDLI